MVAEDTMDGSRLLITDDDAKFSRLLGGYLEQFVAVGRWSRRRIPPGVRMRNDTFLYSDPSDKGYGPARHNDARAH
jgi:hypothetical protein